MNKPKILVIDDEVQIRKLLEITLSTNDFDVKLVENGLEGIRFAATFQPDLIMLDLGLPDVDGQVVLQQLREWFFNPIMILSVKSEEEEIVKALDNGANDYLIKPFRTLELVARVRSHLRNHIKELSEPIIHSSNFYIDIVSRIVKINNEEIKLTQTEFNLLATLARNEGRVLTHHYLLKEVWGKSYSDQTQYLRVFVAQLRKKIEKDANHPEMILTESGIGYRFMLT
ncbi:response regulator transcription factor [Flavobacterium jejuense]|uniref:Response regulator transcription factor n=1 Tax=Flavobacterium jejuense TaxID=1544455 RepID=A0ABX0IUI0_9FLAO|nr:response regulator transcription factor [Flavobacterium jejuense]NHN26800.1 response regulator transcription factor [Flavobacterium jejuense]